MKTRCRKLYTQHGVAGTREVHVGNPMIPREIWRNSELSLLAIASEREIQDSVEAILPSQSTESVGLGDLMKIGNFSDYPPVEVWWRCPYKVINVYILEQIE
jgi:hypothetical protein